MSDRPPAPTPAQFKRLSEVTSVREALMHPEMALRMKAAIPKHLSAERMLRVCALAIQKTPKLAECDMMTLLGAMITLGTLGLEPNTPLGQAYLIPFEKRTRENGRWVTTGVDVQVIIGYKGFIELARRSGQIVSISAQPVYEKDHFEFDYLRADELSHKLTMAGLAARDRMVLQAARERSLPLAIAMAGGYGKQIEQTVAVHLQTVSLAAEHFNECGRSRVPV